MERINKAIKHSKRDVLWFIIYKVILDMIYIFIQKDVYSYYGFAFDWNIGKIIVSWILFLITSISISSNVVNLRTIFLYTTICIGVIPFFVYYQFNSEATTWMLFLQVTILLFMNITMNRINIVKNTQTKKISYSSKSLQVLVICTIGMFFFLSLLKYGLPSFNQLLLKNSATVRAEAQTSILSGIIQNLMCKIVCPLTIMLSLRRGKKITFLFAVVVQIYIYAVTGFKTYLFIIIVVVGVSMLKKCNINKLMLRVLPLICICCSLIYVFWGEIYPYALINERVLYLPAKIKFSYFDYFSKHEFVYFSQSTVGRLLGIESSYTQNIPNLIGETYFNKPNMWTNTGFMADAYANFGVFGMFLIAMFLSAVISKADSFLSRDDNQAKQGIYGVFLLFFISLNDGSAVTVFFSGGMIFALIIAGLVSFNDGEEIKACENRLRRGSVHSHNMAGRDSN